MGLLAGLQEKKLIPKREDERNLNLAGKHPAYCTCHDCTARFLKKRKIKPARPGQVRAEKVKVHPADCGCATCLLLGSVGELPPLPERKAGLFKRLLGKIR